MANSARSVTIAAPMYNEEEIIADFISEIDKVVSKLEGYNFDILLVNDGSKDNSIQKALQCDTALPVTVVDLSRNFGHPVASRVCLEKAAGDAVILMDSDMQDDPVLIPQFIKKYEEGYDVVYAVRSSRESFSKKIIFSFFYLLINFLSIIKLPLNSGNYSLMSRRVVSHLNSIPSGNRYLPGLRAFIGFKQIGIPVARRFRHDNTSRVGLKGLFKLAFDGIFSFSYVPIRFFHAIGIVSVLFSFFLSLWAIYMKLFTDSAIMAWTSQLVSISFFSGIIIIGIGIIGEYLARIYEEIKQYPKYIVDKTYTNYDNGSE